MENFGIILSIPVAFFGSIIFAFIIKKLTTKIINSKCTTTSKSASSWYISPPGEVKLQPE